MRNRTKVELVVAISFIMILTSINVLSITRTISDTGDTVDTYIRNSKGNYWAATGANLQLAIYDLANQSGTVWLPSGTIYFSTTVYLTSNIHLQGAGMYSTILRESGSGDLTRLVCCNKHNVIISDFTVHGNNTRSGGAQTNNIPIDFRGLQNVTIYNIRVIYSSDSGLTFYALALAEYGNIDVGYGVKNFSIDNYEVYCIEGHGLQLGNAYDGTINNYRGNFITNDGMDSSGSYNITCSNFRLRNISVDGIKFTASVGSSNIQLNNINIESNGMGLKIDTLVKNVNVNNIIIKPGSWGIHIRCTGTNGHVNINNFLISGGTIGIKTDSSSINNVTISNGEIIGGNIAGDIGIALGATKDMDINNVRISKTPGRGIYFLTSSRVKIIGCTILGGSYFGSIQAISNNNFTISDCYVIGNNDVGYGGINISGATSKNFKILGNTIENNHQFGLRIFDSGIVNFIIANNIIRIVGAGHLTLDDKSACAAANNVTANNLT